MKVVQLISSLAIGGAETVAVNTAIELKKRNIDSIVIANYSYETVLSKRLLENNIKYYNLKPFFLSNYKGNNAIIKFIKKCVFLIHDFFMPYIIKSIIDIENCDIIHAHLEMTKHLSFDMRKYKIVYTCHSDFDRYCNNYGNRWRKSINRLVRLYDMTIIALNNKMAEKIKSRIPSANVIYIPNGIEFPRCFTSIEKGNLKKLLNLPEPSFLIGHIGRLDSVKNHVKSLHILDYILKTYNTNCYLLIIGKGDNIYRDKIEKKALEMGIKANVIFMGYQENIFEIIKELDAAVLPSINEGFPLTALELQSQNIRSVFSYATPEEAVCNDNCFRLSINDSDSLWAEKIMGHETCKHNYSLDSFDLNNVINQIIDIYENR